MDKVKVNIVASESCSLAALAVAKKLSLENTIVKAVKGGLKGTIGKFDSSLVSFFFFYSFLTLNVFINSTN